MPELELETEVLNDKPAGGGAQGGGNQKEDNVTIPKAELDGLRRELAESKQSAMDWAKLARGGSNNARTIEPAAEEEEIEVDPAEFLDPDAPTGLLPDDTPEKLVEEIARDGVKALQRRGFVSKADAQRIAIEKAADIARKVARETVNSERQKAVSDNVLLTNFPDLKNPESELYKETATIYREAVAMDPSAMKTPAALYLAAKAAKQLIASRRDPDEEEEDRLIRVNSQDGRTRGRKESVHDDMMGDEARAVIKGMGVGEDAFKAEVAALAGERPARRGGK